MLKFQNNGIPECRNFKTLELRNVGISERLDSGMLEFQDVVIPNCWEFQNNGIQEC